MIAILAALAGGTAPQWAGSDAPDAARQRLFEGDFIPYLRLEIGRSEIASLEKEPRRHVRGTVWEGQRAYTNVALHLKGGPGSFRPIHDKPGFTLNFDKFVPGQRFHGLTKLHLNNSVQDPTCLKEKISRELFRLAGVPTPQAGHAIVELNDRKLGLYVLIEGVNRQFLRGHFKNADGCVFDGYSYGDVSAPLNVNLGRDRTDRAGLRRLAEAAQETNLAQRKTKLHRALDVDRFLSFMAMEVILCHRDGYSLDVNNYRIFHDLETDRMVFLPHGMDLMFGDPSLPIAAPMSGLVARCVMEDSELRRQYVQRLAHLSTNVIRVAVITNRVQELAARIQSSLPSDPSVRNRSYRGDAQGIVRFFVERANYLSRSLANNPR